MSALGTPDRKLWYKMNKPELEEPIDGSTKLKFLYGDILEQVVIFLAKAAGHRVDHEQLEVEEQGIKGHLDCTIDDRIVDVKSASKFAFEKFKKGLTKDNDSFGYLDQLEAYMAACDQDKGSFLVINKESGELHLLHHHKPIDEEQFEFKVHDKILASEGPEPPMTKCYDPVPMGKAGNMRLHTNCGYCGFKKECWKDANSGEGLKSFDYSNGPVYFTHVVKEPKVAEIW